MDIKPTVLLAMAIFLVSAPDPDSRAIAEMTANFIVPSDAHALQAAELGERREFIAERKPVAGQDSTDSESTPDATPHDAS